MYLKILRIFLCNCSCRHRERGAFCLAWRSSVFKAFWMATPQKTRLAMTIRAVTFFLLVYLSWLALPAYGSVLPAQKISCEFVEIKVRELLKILVGYANKSVVISEKIVGKVTVDFREVSWREALDTVLQSQGLTKHETERVITIVTADEVTKSGSSLLQSAIFNLRYVSADEVAKLLKSAGVLSSAGRLEAAGGTNSLVITDTSDRLITAKQLLQKLDVPARQVLIEARIVSVDEAFIRELGLELNTTPTKSIGDQQEKSNFVANLRPNQFNFAIARLGDSGILDLRLAALENEGRGRVISKPKLLVADRQSASIEAGAEVPYQEKTKDGDTSTAFKKAVLSLKVTPEVAAKDALKLSLQLNQDKVGQLVVNGVPTIDTRKIQTQVLVHDNETIVLGGIYEWSKMSTVKSIPILDKIPLINFLVSRKVTKWERKELLIFVTTRIVPLQ